LCVTETMKVLEELSVNLSLSESFACLNTQCLRAVQDFATDAAKAEVLPKLLRYNYVG